MPAKLYEWDDWFGQDKFIIVQGDHYNVPQSSMAKQILNAASKRGISIRMDDLGDAFRIRVLKRTEPVQEGSKL